MGFGQVEALEHNGVSLACERLPGRGPTVVWLGGFKSDMTGTKAEALARWAHAEGQSFVRFDYAGHGRSGGRFEEQNISRWLSDTLAVIDRLTEGPLLLVGSSMGGWLALLAARQRPERIKALVLIAPAADFTERLMWASFGDDIRRQILETGRWERPSAYDSEPYPITRQLIEDGRRHLIMDGPIPFAGPIHILQGGQDPDVPQAHVEALAALIQAPALRFDLIEDGDHRLSRPEDIERLVSAVKELSQQLSP